MPWILVRSPTTRDQWVPESGQSGAGPAPSYRPVRADRDQSTTLKLISLGTQAHETPVFHDNFPVY